ncbi:hypothetical protein ACFW84_13610 [Streptomyces anulatus]|uniref:hypothetical protein n=1 Tax=Streptomyces anulatus TaxID=1892 RepID=UPI0036BE1DBA
MPEPSGPVRGLAKRSVEVLSRRMYEAIAPVVDRIEKVPHRTVSIAFTISLAGFSESDVFQQAADWARKHVDVGDNAIVTTHFQAWADRPAGEPRYELVLALLAM